MTNSDSSTHVNPDFVFLQEPLKNLRVACIHRAPAPALHRYSIPGPCFSPCFSKNIHGGQGTCTGRLRMKQIKYQKDFSSRLFSGHTKLFNQDNSTVGGLTSDDIDKARSAKKTEYKQHKQVVSTLTFFFYQCLFDNDQYCMFEIVAKALHCQQSMRAKMQSFFFFISAQ